MNSLFGVVLEVLNVYIVPAFFTFSLVVFIWGLCKYYIVGVYNELELEAAKVLMAYALVSFVVVSGLWYLLTYLIGDIPFDIPL